MNIDKLNDLTDFLAEGIPPLASEIIIGKTEGNVADEIFAASSESLKITAKWFRKLGVIINEDWCDYWANRLRNEFLLKEGL